MEEKIKIKFKRYRYSDWETEIRENYISLELLIYTLGMQYYTYQFDLTPEKMN